ncbi:MAG: hypothetical protein H8E48_03820 [Chloroflexi bacterium]|nr:hypothetical protein [Chloroflexota bacterium]
MEQPMRSFVMNAPPLDRPATEPSQPGDFLRIPSWAYAGAASFAVLALVVTVAIGGAFQQMSDSDGGQSAFSSAPQAESAGAAATDSALDAVISERNGATSGSSGDQDAPVSMAAAPAAPPPSEPSALGEPAEAPVAAFSAESASPETSAGLAIAAPELESETVPSPETAGADGADGGALLKQDEAEAKSLMPEMASEEPITEGPSISQTTAQADAVDQIPEQAQSSEPVPELINNDADDDSFGWEWLVAAAAGLVILASLMGLYFRWRAARQFP